MVYTSENHSKHLLMCHLIFVCKYRKKLLVRLGEYIKQETQRIAKHFWKERTFWSDGYFSCSIGNVSKATIQRYIETQGS